MIRAPFDSRWNRHAPQCYRLRRLFLDFIQGQAKLMELSLETHVPLGPIGCAWAGHFAWQK